MRVVIVDDEHFACAALKKLTSDYFISRNMPYTCTAFNDSKKALDHLLKNGADLLLTDIKMADIDGLRLAALTKEKLSGTSTVLISGYAEFTFAQEALRYEVSDYLLKPINRKQIYECLDKQTASFLKKKEQSGKEECEKRNSLYHRINHEPDFTGDMLIKHPPESEAMSMFMVMLKGKEKIHEPKRISEALVVDIEDSKEATICRIYFCPEELGGKAKDRITKQCSQCYKTIAADHPDTKLSFSISKCVSTASPLKDILNQCKLALSGKLLAPDKYIFDYEKMTETGRSDPIDTVFEHELISSFEFHNMVLAKNIVDTQIDKLSKRGDSSLLHLAELLSRSITVINKAIYDLNHTSTLDKNRQISYIPEISLSHFKSLEDMKLFLYEKIESVYTNINNNTLNTNAVGRLKKYVEENYYLNISLTDISQKIFYLNPSYVSRLFKAQTGISFSKYLLTYRLKKAAEYLEGKDEISIQEVSSLTGFSDVSYFVRQFKKEYGETPGDYQKRTRN